MTDSHTPIGQNVLCPCGSSRKYKHCHGSNRWGRTKTEDARGDSATIKEIRRIREQGLGEPIDCAQILGQRVVRIGERFISLDPRKTFHDFLLEYLIHLIGLELISADSNEMRHPLLRWFRIVLARRSQWVAVSGSLISFVPIGAEGAIFSVSYDLFSLEHNVGLQDSLLKRIRNSQTFFGAVYELKVAASLVRAGFSVEFENENDRTTTHCEYIATHIQTNKSFSVECKRRMIEDGDDHDPLRRIGRQISRALQKKADHERLVFIDLNVPDRDGSFMESKIRHVSNQISKLERNKTNGARLPPAYIFLSNHPNHHHLVDAGIPGGWAARGFKVPEFKSGKVAASLEELVEWRSRNREVWDLETSLQDQMIPETFDGNTHEFTSKVGKGIPSIGSEILIEDNDGVTVPGKVKAAAVHEETREIELAVQVVGGEILHRMTAMTPEEIRLWHAHSETFFGMKGPGRRVGRSALAMYDFFLDSYSDKSRESLLEHLRESGDTDSHAERSPEELRQLCARRITMLVWNARANTEQRVPIMVGRMDN